MSAIERIRRNIEALIKETGSNPNAFAKSIGMPSPQLYNYLSGKNDPSVDQLERIAGALGVSIAALTGDEIPSPPKQEVSLKDLQLACITAILRADRGDLELLQDAFPDLFKPALDQQKGRSSG